MTLVEDLKWRGLIKDISSPELEEKLNQGGLTFYIGTDPTADSLHVGHLSSFLISKRLKEAGHHPILLVGGGTGMIGDPRPTTERAMISKEQVRHNFECLKKQVEDIFGFEVVNNNDWYQDINVIDFLRDYGKYFNVNYMLDKDIIRRRLDSGITYTEFSYMILQALDFKHLHECNGVDLQCAGSDQWGNITAGIDLIRKSTGDEVYGFTMPLVTDSQGKKFGKSEGNALWLDKTKTAFAYSRCFGRRSASSAGNRGVLLFWPPSWWHLLFQFLLLLHCAYNYCLSFGGCYDRPKEVFIMDVVSSAKTDMFRMRINPEIRSRLERVYAQNGLSLTDAVNVFFQQSLNAGGLPFQVTEDNAALIQAKALSRLMKELEAGLTDPVSYSEDDVYRMLGVEKEA